MKFLFGCCVVGVASLVAAGCSGSGNGSAAEVVSSGEANPSAENTATGSRPAQNRPGPGSAWVIFGADTVVAEVASTPAVRAQGLMDREEVPAGTGMLFVFPDNELRSFWMKDTHVDLDIAFFNESFEVVDIKQMTALDTDLTDSEAPSTLALEVIQGWLEEKGIEVGDAARVVFGPGLKVS